MAPTSRKRRLREFTALTPDWLVARAPSHRRLWIAFSGGLDSTVLLNLAHVAGLNPRAVHVNHHLQPAASEWAEHCGAVCAQWQVSCALKDVQVAADDPAGPEAAARAARYEALRSLLDSGDVLVTAHHRGDQAETVLLRLLRGTGIEGLAAMRELTSFAPGRLWRPLLEVPREQIRAYAELHRLHWIEDAHNTDPRYARSFLRSKVLPLLRERWPAYEESLARLAGHAAGAQLVLDEQAQRDVMDATQPAASGDAALSVNRLFSLSTTRRHNALRYWLQARNLDLPPAEVLTRVDDQLLRARADAEPCIGFGGTELRRFRDGLYAMPRLPPPPQELQLEWRGSARVELPTGCGVLDLGQPPPRPLVVRFARGGEKLKPACGGPTRTLKNLFQEAGVPTWVRQRTPLIELDGRLAAVADDWCSREWQEFCRDFGGELRWRCSLPGRQDKTALSRQAGPLLS